MLYTGKGDGGTTKLYGPQKDRISKASEMPEALGTLDELNAFLGFIKARFASSEPRIAELLHEVQEALFIVQAQTAGAEKQLRDNAVTNVEEWVNAIEKYIPPLKGFSIAGGTELSALLDVARTLSRRAERRVVAVKEAGLRELAPLTMQYMNRLSSLLFALARLANHLAGVKEENPSY
jgi:cob(I)alamin adenosyltransferase